MHIEPGLYSSTVDIVVAMNDKVRKRIDASKYEYNGIYISVDKITLKIAVHLTEDRSVFVFQSPDSTLTFGCALEPGVMMSGKGPHYPRHSHDIRRHSLMI